LGRNGCAASDGRYQCGRWSEVVVDEVDDVVNGAGWRCRVVVRSAVRRLGERFGKSEVEGLKAAALLAHLIRERRTCTHPVSEYCVSPVHTVLVPPVVPSTPYRIRWLNESGACIRSRHTPPPRELSRRRMEPKRKGGCGTGP
jgi:hypothetical protein